LLATEHFQIYHYQLWQTYFEFIKLKAVWGL